METNLKFNSAICTSRQQSERLLALGLKKETADMEIHSFKDDEQETFETGYANKGYMEPEFAEIVDCFPAWSLHRLLSLLPTEYIADIDFQQVMQDFVFRSQDMYDEVISCIETLIKEGYFNEEYLE